MVPRRIGREGLVTNEAKESPGEGELASVQQSAVVPQTKRRGALRRLFDWFWGGPELAALKSSFRPGTPAELELRRRARLALECAEQLSNQYSLANGPADAAVCELSAEAVYWSLLAQRSAHADASAPNLATLWGQVDPGLLSTAAGSAAAAEALGAVVRSQTSTDYAELPPEHAARLAGSLRAFAAALTRETDGDRSRVERFWLRRFFRLSLVALFFALLGVGAWFEAERREEARDVARGKPWVASSRYPEGHCVSPAQDCESSPMFFFATTDEQNPWVEFDLGKKEKLTGFRVDNRVECCPERAVPLVLEVSNDHTTWKEVARRNNEFRKWRGSLPGVEARWVRLRLARKDLLHLRRVRLFN